MTFYEPYNLAYRKGGTGGPKCRHVSATEPRNSSVSQRTWTALNKSAPAEDHESNNKRRNAVGNAFAVPVIRRLRSALCVALQGSPTEAMTLWCNQTLAAPFHADVLDDTLQPIAHIAAQFQGLQDDFASYVPQCWKHCLIGPDPGAGGRNKNARKEQHQ